MKTILAIAEWGINGTKCMLLELMKGDSLEGSAYTPMYNPLILSFFYTRGHKKNKDEFEIILTF